MLLLFCSYLYLLVEDNIMGRKRKYKTEKELKESNRVKSRKYYRKHAKKIKEKRMKRYYEQMEKELS